MATATSIEVLDRTVESVQKLGATTLWGQHITRGNVTMFVGETSAGKTVFLHNLAYRLSSGTAFLGVIPPYPLRVLYIDYESNDELLLEHLSTIGTHENWHFLDLDTVAPGQPLLDHVTGLIMSQRYDVVVFDPLVEAYPVRDENNNAEATVQMLAFRRVARTTGAAIVVVHNSGHRAKDPDEGGATNIKFLARGATARLDRADVGINWVATAAQERAMQVVKSRMSNLGAEINVRFGDNLGYEVTTVRQGSSPQIHLGSDKIDLVLGLCASNPSLSHYKIVEKEKAMLLAAGISRASYYRILAAYPCQHRRTTSPEASAEHP